MIYSVNNRNYRVSDNNADTYGSADQALSHPYYDRMDIVLADFGEEHDCPVHVISSIKESVRSLG